MTRAHLVFVGVTAAPAWLVLDDAGLLTAPEQIAAGNVALRLLPFIALGLGAAWLATRLSTRDRVVFLVALGSVLALHLVTAGFSVGAVLGLGALIAAGLGPEPIGPAPAASSHRPSGPVQDQDPSQAED